MKKCLIFLLKGLSLSLAVLTVWACPALANPKASKSPDLLFPSVDELSGGGEHWVQSILPVDQSGACTVYSATYAYFAKDVRPLFDIPRKNVYSINVRFHECNNTEDAAALYDKFSKVGDDDKKRHMSMGERSLIYVVPNEKNVLMGNYYLTALYRYMVMQVHADDGFVLMDIGDIVGKRLSTYLDMDGALSNGITLSVSKENRAVKNEFITFSGNDITRIDINGTIYDSSGARVPGASVTVLETGDQKFTDKNGDFAFYLGDDEDGEDMSIFRAITLADVYTALESGYYSTDISYKAQDRIGQDVWRLDIKPDGSLTGVSYNIADERQLQVYGKIDTQSIEITRNCGTSFMGECRQYFKATADEEGLFKGTWTGTGGGGEWVLYPLAYGKKSTNVSLEEADLLMELSGLTEKKDDKSEAWIVSGAKEKFITLTPKRKNQNDFYVSGVNLVLDVTGVLESKDKAEALPAKGIYIYGVNPDNTLKALASSPELPLGSRNVQGIIDITQIYRGTSYSKYKLGFLKSEDEVSIKLKPSVEMVFAVAGRKADAPGAVKISFVTFSGEDIAGSGNAIKADKSPDLVFTLDIASYGSILKGVSVKSFGESRQWNTHTTQFHPGIALVKGGKVLNNTDGSLNYPLQQLNERLNLYMTRGSADIDKITEFEVILHLDNGDITVPVKKP